MISQQNKLVYGDLSHFTWLDVLYMISARNISSSITDLVRHLLQVRNKNLIQARHPMPTLVTKEKKFHQVITAVTVQNLVAHSEDISTDSIIIIWQLARLAWKIPCQRMCLVLI